MEINLTYIEPYQIPIIIVSSLIISFILGIDWNEFKTIYKYNLWRYLKAEYF